MNALRTSLLVSALFSLTTWAGKPAADKGEHPGERSGKHADKHATDGAGEHKADCHHPPVPSDAAAAKPEKQAQGWVLTRGEKLTEGPVVKVSDLLATAAAQEGKTVRVEGKVRKACEKKGCWMELAHDAKSPGVRVTFKNYGFFVPLDSEGSQARVEGKVLVAQLSEERAKHYEGEGAIVPRTKDGKAQEVQLVATGVELRR